MLYLLDLDDTLIKGYMSRPDHDYSIIEVLPGRVEKLRDLQERGDAIGIVTNQGGVAFGFVTFVDMVSKLYNAMDKLVGLYPQQLRKQVRIVDCVPNWEPVPEKWHGVVTCYVCYHDTRGKAPYNDPVEAARRKPSGAMIREAIADYPDQAARGVLYVGDREEDLQAAQDAGVGFQWAHIFFKDT